MMLAMMCLGAALHQMQSQVVGDHVEPLVSTPCYGSKTMPEYMLGPNSMLVGFWKPSVEGLEEAIGGDLLSSSNMVLKDLRG